MNRYIIYCTPEQTEKALELGAPIEDCEYNDGTPTIFIGWHPDEKEYKIPTTQQMIGWLEEQGQSIEVSRLYRNNPNWSVFVDDIQIVGMYYPTRQKAILAGIDIALVKLKEIRKK